MRDGLEGLYWTVRLTRRSTLPRFRYLQALTKSIPLASCESHSLCSSPLCCARCRSTHSRRTGRHWLSPSRQNARLELFLYRRGAQIARQSPSITSCAPLAQEDRVRSRYGLRPRVLRLTRMAVRLTFRPVLTGPVRRLRATPPRQVL